MQIEHDIQCAALSVMKFVWFLRREGLADVLIPVIHHRLLLLIFGISLKSREKKIKFQYVTISSKNHCKITLI